MFKTRINLFMIFFHFILIVCSMQLFNSKPSSPKSKKADKNSEVLLLTNEDFKGKMNSKKYSDKNEARARVFANKWINSSLKGYKLASLLKSAKENSDINVYKATFTKISGDSLVKKLCFKTDGNQGLVLDSKKKCSRLLSIDENHNGNSHSLDEEDDMNSKVDETAHEMKNHSNQFHDQAGVGNAHPGKNLVENHEDLGQLKLNNPGHLENESGLINNNNLANNYQDHNLPPNSQNNHIESNEHHLINNNFPNGGNNNINHDNHNLNSTSNLSGSRNDMNDLHANTMINNSNDNNNYKDSMLNQGNGNIDHNMNMDPKNLANQAPFQNHEFNENSHALPQVNHLNINSHESNMVQTPQINNNSMNSGKNMAHANNNTNYNVPLPKSIMNQAPPSLRNITRSKLRSNRNNMPSNQNVHSNIQNTRISKSNLGRPTVPSKFPSTPIVGTNVANRNTKAFSRRSNVLNVSSSIAANRYNKIHRSHPLSLARNWNIPSMTKDSINPKPNKLPTIDKSKIIASAIKSDGSQQYKRVEVDNIGAGRIKNNKAQNIPNPKNMNSKTSKHINKIPQKRNLNKIRKSNTNNLRLQNPNNKLRNTNTNLRWNYDLRNGLVEQGITANGLGITNGNNNSLMGQTNKVGMIQNNQNAVFPQQNQNRPSSLDNMNGNMGLQANPNPQGKFVKRRGTNTKNSLNGMNIPSNSNVPLTTGKDNLRNILEKDPLDLNSIPSGASINKIQNKGKNLNRHYAYKLPKPNQIKSINNKMNNKKLGKTSLPQTNTNKVNQVRNLRWSYNTGMKTNNLSNTNAPFKSNRKLDSNNKHAISENQHLLNHDN